MRRHLDNVEILKYTSCIIFADEEEEGDIMQSDSKSLAWGGVENQHSIDVATPPPLPRV
jgi:hypothetical protein